METRQRYLEHVQTMFTLLGDTEAAAKAHAQTVMDMETALAKASLTRVEKRDPYKLFHKLTRAQLTSLAPSFDWTGYLTTLGIPRYRRRQRHRAGVLQSSSTRC